MGFINVGTTSKLKNSLTSKFPIYIEKKHILVPHNVEEIEKIRKIHCNLKVRRNLAKNQLTIASLAENCIKFKVSYYFLFFLFSFQIYF